MKTVGPREMVGPIANQSKNWDTEKLMTHIWDTVALVV